VVVHAIAKVERLVMKGIIQLISLLVITFALLAIYSFTDYELKFAGVEIKKTNIRNFVLGIPENNIGKSLRRLDTIKKTNELDTSSQRILLIGDSMIEYFMLRMKDYTYFNNHNLKTVIWYSSQTKWYGSYDTLSYFIKEYKPSYVFLVLGANELFVGDIIKKRTQYVKNIMSQLDTLKFVWVGPPNWKDDTGINTMIKRNVGKGRYFPSKNLNYKRTKDGAHPTKASAALWMDSVAVWMMNESRYPIIMKKPIERTKKSANLTILQPLK